MKLESHFDQFLTGTVNLNQSRIDTLDSRLAAVEFHAGSSALRALGHEGRGLFIQERDPEGR